MTRRDVSQSVSFIYEIQLQRTHIFPTHVFVIAFTEASTDKHIIDDNVSRENNKEKEKAEKTETEDDEGVEDEEEEEEQQAEAKVIGRQPPSIPSPHSTLTHTHEHCRIRIARFYTFWFIHHGPMDGPTGRRIDNHNLSY